MCGIVSLLNSGKIDNSNLILEGIRAIKNRGYDSVSICSINSNDNKMNITKYIKEEKNDCFSLIEQNFGIHKGMNNLLAHTRWATHGGITYENAHPHLDSIFPNRIALIHNGIITNYIELKNFLIKHNITFNSETDTEVIVNLIGYYLKNGFGSKINTLLDAIKLSINELEGTFALIIIDKNDPYSQYVCKRGSPLVVGNNNDICMVSSEVSGFCGNFKNYHKVNDNNIIQIKRENDGIKFYIDNKLSTLSTNEIVHSTIHSTSPSPYTHWMIKEIMEQSEWASSAMNNGGRILNDFNVKLGGLRHKEEQLLKIKHLVIIACGTSYHAGLFGQKFFQSISGFDTVRVFDASEFQLNDLTKNDCGVIVLSQSGETRDVISCIEMIRQNCPDIIICSVVNVVDSFISNEADLGVYINCSKENAVAATKSFTNQVIVLALISIWFAQQRLINQTIRGKLIESLRNLPDLIKNILGTIHTNSTDIVNIINENGHNNIILLGNDKGLVTCLEGALKIKEVSYINACAYPSGCLKHGVIATINKGTPIIFIRIGNTEQITKIDIAAHETKARGAYLIQIGPHKNDFYDKWIKIPNDQFFEGLLATIPLQYIAYLLALEFGYNPDYPRNLAKCVTVA